MKEVAAFMHIGYYTLYRLVKRGKIKAINVATAGKRPLYAIDPHDLQAYYDAIGSAGTEGDPRPSLPPGSDVLPEQLGSLQARE